MLLEKLSKVCISPITNIIAGIFLLSVFFIAGRNIVQTFAVAEMTSLNNLRPEPIDYFWRLNIHQAPLDKNKIRYYADYYEHLLQVFPGLRDDYGLLGYCYHYLNDDPKAVKFLKMAIQNYPDYFWNYYNLAVIDIKESRYNHATDLLQKALKVDPMTSLKRMFTSQMVYLPLLEGNEKRAIVAVTLHLKEAYKSSFILLQVLNHIEHSKKDQEMITKLKPELYAF